MAIKYELGENPGEITATDEDSGQSVPVYDPDMYDELKAGNQPTAEQNSKVSEGFSEPQTTEDPKAPDQGSAVPVDPRLPPPVADDTAKAWQSAQAVAQPMFTDPGDSTAPKSLVPGNPVPNLPAPPTAPAGTSLLQADYKPGQSGQPFDPNKEDQRNNDLLDKRLALQGREEAENSIRREQEIELGRQKSEDEDRLAEATAKEARYDKELKTVVNKEINPNRLSENQGFFGSLLGIVGQTLAFLDNTPEGAFRQFNAMLERRIDRDIAAQKEEKDSQIARLSKVLGSEKEAELHYRANARQLGTNVLQSKLDQLGVSNKYQDFMDQETDKTLALNDQAKAASLAKPGSAEFKFGIPKPVKPAGTGANKLNNDVTKELDKIHVSQKAYDDAFGEPISKQQNAPTVSEAVTNVSRIDNDVSLLDALAKANGGTIPTTGVWRVPQTFIQQAARAGIKDGMQAEQAGQVLNQYINQQARSYGGAITDSDREAALTEAGASTEGKMFFLRRLRNKTNEGIKATLARKLPGADNKALEIYMKSLHSGTGVTQSDAVPFEIENVPDASKSVPRTVMDAAKNVGNKILNSVEAAPLGKNDKPKPKPGETGWDEENGQYADNSGVTDPNRGASRVDAVANTGALPADGPPVGAEVPLTLQLNQSQRDQLNAAYKKITGKSLDEIYQGSISSRILGANPQDTTTGPNVKKMREENLAKIRKALGF